MRRASADVVRVTPLAVINRIARRCISVKHEPLEQRHRAIVLAHRLVTEPVSDSQSTKRSNCVHEERMRPVERIDVATRIRCARPAHGLNGSGGHQRHFIETFLPNVERNRSFIQQPEEISISADIIEAVIMNAAMRQMRRHELNGVVPSVVQKMPFARGIELKNGRAELEPLGPFRPPPAGVSSSHSEDRRALRGGPRILDAAQFARGCLEQRTDFPLQPGWREIRANNEHGSFDSNPRDNAACRARAGQYARRILNVSGSTKAGSAVQPKEVWGGTLAAPVTSFLI